MAKKDTALLFVPAIIGGIIILAILLLDLQLADFQKAYFQEVAEETRRNNFFLVRAFRDLLENGPVVVKGQSDSPFRTGYSICYLIN